MTTDRIRRRIEALLDEADQAVAQSHWDVARDRARNVLAFDPDNTDAKAYLAAAERALGNLTPQPPPLKREGENLGVQGPLAGSAQALESLQTPATASATPSPSIPLPSREREIVGY